jgi:putative ABC transport system permease protein
VAWWRRRPLHDFDDEIRAHVEAEEARLRDRGATPDDARRRARVAFGGITQAREGFRERSRWRWFDTSWQDVRYGGRLMRRSPGFTITAVVVLALGIGVNTALFSVINGLFFRDLHVSQPDRLVYLQTKSPTGRLLGIVDQDDAAFLRDAAKDLADFTAHAGMPADVAVDGETFRLHGEVVEANYFDLLGVSIERGRAFRASDNELSNPDLTVIVSHEFWVKRLKGDAAAIGREVRINGRMFRIIGIAAGAFKGLASPFRPSQWWVPNTQVAAGRGDLGPIARLKPGVDVQALEVLVAGLTPGLVRRQWEGMSRSRGRASVWPWEIYRNKAYPIARIADVDIPSEPEARLVPAPVLAAVTTVSGLVLLIACANIAGLLLARGTSRTGEVAVRQALGAGGLRLFRQVLTESVLLAGSGALVGVGVAIALVRLFSAVTPATLSVAVAIDARVLGFAVCGSLVTGVLVGLTPALQATRVQLLQALGAGIVGSRRTGRSFARWTVVPQVVVALVLLLVATVQVRALRQVEARNPGYRTGGTAVLEIGRGVMGLQQWTLGMIRLDPKDEANDRAFARAVVNATAAVPGVDQFAVVSSLPLRSLPVERRVLEQDALHAPPSSRISAAACVVSDDYFKVMDMHLVAGRTFDDRDRPFETGGPHAAVVSASVASALGGAGLIGRFIALAPDVSGPPDWLEVIGIVNDVDPILDDGRVHPVVYQALKQQARPGLGTLLVRGHGDAAALMMSVRKAILGSAPSAEITGVRTLDDMAGELLYPRRLAAGILGASAAIGLALACLGLYGVVAYTAAQRTREFGIRATLGATRQDIVRLVLHDGAIVLGAGLGPGVLLGAVALRVASSVVRGLPTFDAVVFITVPFALVLVVLVACLSPALRASRIDPAQVIRGE